MALQLEISSTTQRQSNKELKAELTKRDLRRTEVCSLVLSHREVGRKISRSILKKWRAHIAEDELNSLVDLALCEAAMRYDSEMGAQFVTFLFYHIRGHLIKTISKAKKESDFKMAFNAGTEVSLEENANFSQDDINSYLIEKEEKSLSNNPERAVSLMQEIEICNQARERLADLDAQVIRRCFLEGEQVIEVARELGLSRHYVSRIKTRALKKLKKMINSANADDSYKVQLKTMAKHFGEQTRGVREKANAVG